VYIVEPDDEEDWKKHGRHEYTTVEIACHLSHLSAVLEAYEAGHEVVLITEDDVSISDDFLRNWKEYAELAPKNWRVLQWSTSNAAVLGQNKNMIKDPWISWQPDHFGARGYMLNRAGMEEILTHTYLRRADGDGNSSYWAIDKPGIGVSDELVYYYNKGAAYTSTFAWIGTMGGETTFGHDGKHHVLEIEASSNQSLSVFHPSNRSESILVAMNCLFSDVENLVKGMNQVKADAASLTACHPKSLWKIKIVLADVSLRSFFEEQASSLPENVQTRVFVGTKAFNKFQWIADLSKEIADHDYLLLKDNDIRLAGFSWNTFMERKGDAIISGIPRQSVDESLLTHMHTKNRQWFQYHDGQRWKELHVPE
jgi:GR25 family glycosyltransferase involved in LPS biosynthesis